MKLTPVQKRVLQEINDNGAVDVRYDAICQRVFLHWADHRRGVCKIRYITVDRLAKYGLLYMVSHSQWHIDKTYTITDAGRGALKSISEGGT